MSTHEIKVIKINNIQSIPNADFLELIKVWDYDCVVQKGQFKLGDLACFIEPDTVVDTNKSEFAFLARKGKSNKLRITVRRFRGVWSSGLLMPVPEHVKENDNLWDYFEVERWEPKESNLISSAGGNLGANFAESGPSFDVPYYDLENFKKYSKLLNDDEEVVLTTKMHGSQAKYIYSNGRMFCGSRKQWKKPPGFYYSNSKYHTWWQTIILHALELYFNYNPEKIHNFFVKSTKQWIRKYKNKFVYEVPKNAWWEALKQNPWIETWCKQNPNVVLFGEIVGDSVQGEHFHYGHKNGSIGFYVFDILENSKWIPNIQFYQDKIYNRFNGLKFVPLLYIGKLNKELIEKLAEEKETFNGANHIREGVVIKPVHEREVERFGRLALKYVANKYLELS